MDKTTIFRCLVVSVLIAFLASLVSTTVLSVPASGETVIDMSEMDADAMEAMSDEALGHYIATQPRKKVSGLERVFYSLSHPQIVYFYLRGFITWFLVLFLATLVVSYWNRRAFSQSLNT